MGWRLWLRALAKVPEFPNRWLQLEERVHRLERQYRRLQQAIDLSRSSLDVSPELIREFEEWKRHQKTPARPLVSVCIATYNRAGLLTERAVPSVLKQTYRDVEIIVVGDACTDDTAARLERVNDPRLRFVNLPQRGNYPTEPARRWMVAGSEPMNACLELSRGDFITHLDDDDEYSPDRIEKLVEFCQSTNCDLVWHPFWSEAADGRWQLNQAERLAMGQLTNGSILYRSWFKRVRWNLEAYRFLEPGDWNRLRRFIYVGADCRRYSEPLLRHFAERRQGAS